MKSTLWHSGLVGAAGDEPCAMETVRCFRGGCFSAVSTMSAFECSPSTVSADDRPSRLCALRLSFCREVFGFASNSDWPAARAEFFEGV